MAGGELSDDEVGRRLAAARGHERETNKEFAERMGEHRTRISKWELGQFGRRGRERQGVIDQYVRETELPEEFFVIDLADLPLMYAAWQRARRFRTPEEFLRALDELVDPPPE